MSRYTKTCPKCGGQGMIVCPECFGTGYDVGIGTCRVCDGFREIDCPHCDGSGEVDYEPDDYDPDLANEEELPGWL